MQAKPHRRDVRIPPPLPLPLSQISAGRIRLTINRWENLLTCSVCQAVQVSLDDLLHHSAFPGIFCHACLEQLNDSKSTAGSGWPIPDLMGFGRNHDTTISNSFPSVSREEASRGPALLVKYLKILLSRIEEEDTQKGSIVCQTKSDREPAGETEDDWADVLKSCVDAGKESVKETSNDISNDVSHDRSVTPYGSMNRTFFVETLSPPMRRMQHAQSEAFFSRNDQGGEIYDAGTRRRRRRSRHLSNMKCFDCCDIDGSVQGVKRCKNNGVDQFDFPSLASMKRMEDQDTASRPGSTSDDGDQTISLFEGKTLDPPSNDMNGYGDTFLDAYVNSIANSLESPTGNGGRSAADAVATKIDHTQKDGNQRPSAHISNGMARLMAANDINDCPTAESLSASQSRSEKTETSAVSTRKCGHTYNSNEVHVGPMSATKLVPQEPWLGDWNRPNRSLSSVNDMAPPEGSQKNHQFISSQKLASGKLSKSSVQDYQDRMVSQNDCRDQHSPRRTYLDADAVIGENRRVLVSLALERVDSYETEASVDTRLLPQTADFTPAVADAFECSIDSRLLPQTADFLRTEPECSKQCQSQRPMYTETQLMIGGVDGLPRTLKGADSYSVHCLPTRERTPLNQVEADTSGLQGSIVSHLIPQPSNVSGPELITTKVVAMVEPVRRPPTVEFDGPPSTVYWKSKQESFHDSPLTPTDLPWAVESSRDAHPTAAASNVCESASGTLTPYKNPFTCREVSGSSPIRKLDKSLPLKTPELRAIEQIKARRITPLSVSTTTRNMHQTVAPCLVVVQLEESDNRLARSLSESGLWDIVNGSDFKQSVLLMNSLASYEDVFPKSDNTLLVIDAGTVSLNAPLFNVTGSEVPSLSVCIPNFEYLMARILGWHVVSSACLPKLKTGASYSAVGTDAVWGDFMLYAKALDASKSRDSLYSWLKCAPWWGCSIVSPCASSVERCPRRTSFLSNFNVLVPDIRSKDNLSLASTGGEVVAARLKQPTCGEVKVLCHILGANVFSSIPEAGDNDYGEVSSKTFLILLPDSMIPWSFGDSFAQTPPMTELVRHFLPPKKLQEVSRRNSTDTSIKSKTFHFVCYSWLIDSICADVMAPLENYSATGTIPAFYHTDNERQETSRNSWDSEQKRT